MTHSWMQRSLVILLGTSAIALFGCTPTMTSSPPSVDSISSSHSASNGANDRASDRANDTSPNRATDSVADTVGTKIVSEDEVLVLGDISNEPTRTLNRFQPLADYLADNLEPFKVGQVKVAPDIFTMANWLASGEVDLYFDSPYPALLVSDRSNSSIILRRWKDGIAEYHSIIFASASSGITELSDLKGHAIAFDEVYSTSGFMVPYELLQNAGLRLVGKTSPESAVHPDEVGYVFSQEDSSTIQWVVSNRVVAGAIDSPSFYEIQDDVRRSFTILAESEPVPRQVVVASPQLPDETLALLKDALTQTHQTSAGRQVLEQFDNTARFDEFPDGADADMEAIRRIHVAIQAP